MPALQTWPSILVNSNTPSCWPSSTSARRPTPSPPLLHAHDTRARGAARHARGPAKPVHRTRNDPGAAVIATPPRLAERLLAWSMPDPSWREGVLGDLSEEFNTMTTEAGART